MNAVGRNGHIRIGVEFELNGIPTSAHLNVLSLGSYSMLLGM